MAMDYLKNYAYMGKKNPDPRMQEMQDSQAYPMALKMFQSMHGLEMTGKFDVPTQKLMAMPRCGMQDVYTMEDMGMDMTGKRKRRYALQGGKWPKSSLTYRFENYTPEMRQSDVESEIRRAFDAWEMVTNLKFTKDDTSVPDIWIKFAAGSHGDGSPFDGQSGVLAHAYFPTTDPIGGDAHFDEAELWTLNVAQGTNLFQVAAHEFGHSLGLGHSSINEALMAPFYRGYQSNFMLHDDDIKGIQALYGLKVSGGSSTTTSVPPTEPTQPMEKPDLKKFCDAATFDAVTDVMFGSRLYTYAFYQDLYVRLDGSGIIETYPKKISSGWPSLENNLDAAVYMPATYDYRWTWNNGWKIEKTETAPPATYFFKGTKYWKIENERFASGYPRQISSDWTGLPNNVDAAFTWSGNGRIYFIKGNQYYRISKNSLAVDSGYPRPLSVWGSKLTSVDAATVYNEKTYFFKGNQHYLYDDQVADVATGYPKSNNLFLKCEKFQNILDTINKAPSSTYSVFTLSALIATVIAIIY